MKARLIPLYFDQGRDDEFDLQTSNLKRLIGEVAEILPAQALGTQLPQNADAVVFPQLLGEAYRQVDLFRDLTVPILIITSEFGTVSMWDWEIASYLRSQGVSTLAPYNLEQAKQICRTLKLIRKLKESKLLVFQDNPGEGFQASIFKRFYWWEEECSQRMKDKFGITVVQKSFRDLAQKAIRIPDPQAEHVWESQALPTQGVKKPALLSALKLYLAIKQEIIEEGNVLAAGINCLNESHFTDTTPCLAWNILFEENDILWGCEADTVSMLAKVILHKVLRTPIMMSNLYPFLMGQAALKHEHIPDFPDEPNPENLILIAHCGYLGVLPVSMSTDWTLKPKVLSIVNENAHAIDARLPLGPLTLAKLGPTMDKLSIIESSLEKYIQYPDSHCLNGAIVKVPDGRRLMHELDSHHYLLLNGHVRTEIETIAKLLNINTHTL